MDVDENPLSGVTVTDSVGNSTTTGVDGTYELAVPSGNRAIAPSLEDYVFCPSVLELDVVEDLSGQDFIACSNIMVNGTFTRNAGGWDFPEAEDDRASGETDTTRYRSAPTSGRTGIPTDALFNVYSYSNARSQKYHLPADATSLTLHVWVYRTSDDTLSSEQAHPPKDLGFEERLLTYDAQYVQLLDEDDNLLENLEWWYGINQPSWNLKSYNLTKWAGSTVKIQFGTYNDGVGGKTAMWVDDAALVVCPSDPPPPPPPPPPLGCYDAIINGDFENNDGWYIPITAYSAGYSTSQVYNGWRSMRTGIVYQSHNRYSYSPFRQMITIPSYATKALLSMWLWQKTGESTLLEPLMLPTGDDLTLENIEALNAGDGQYLLVMDEWFNIKETLFWERKNIQGWRYKDFKLQSYAGQKIYLQWGTYNDGYDGVTSMYVDNVELDICH
jgi:hypothetical protein